MVVVCWPSGALQSTVAWSRARGLGVLLSFAPGVYGDGVLRMWHAGDAGQCAGEALPCVPSSWVSLRMTWKDSVAIYWAYLGIQLQFLSLPHFSKQLALLQ